MKKKPDCRWNHGICLCGCKRIVCELLGDDVSPSFHQACIEMKNTKDFDTWKKIINEGKSEYLSFARTLLNKVWKIEKDKESI